MQIDTVRVVGGIIVNKSKAHETRWHEKIKQDTTLSRELCERNGRYSCWLGKADENRN